MSNKILSGNLYYIEWNQERQEEALKEIERLVKGLNKIIKKERELKGSGV